MRRAGRELLSLALMDARNHTLHLLSLYEEALGSPDLAVPRTEDAGVVPPVWLAGHIGWFAEWWIGRNTQRAFGADCPVRPTRLAAIDPHADDWWDPAQATREQIWSPGLPDLGQTKAYLLETLESTLELLEHAAETDPGLYFYRLALFHEDLRGEQFIVMAQTLGLLPRHRAAAGFGHARAAGAAFHAMGARPARPAADSPLRRSRVRTASTCPNSRSTPSP